MKRFVPRYLDPASRLGEILFGLIMVLTVTLTAGFPVFWTDAPRCPQPNSPSGEPPSSTCQITLDTSSTVGVVTPVG